MNAPRPVEPVHFLVFGTALRSESLNERLARLAEVTIEANRGEGEVWRRNVSRPEDPQVIKEVAR